MTKQNTHEKKNWNKNTIPKALVSNWVKELKEEQKKETVEKRTYCEKMQQKWKTTKANYEMWPKKKQQQLDKNPTNQSQAYTDLRSENESPTKTSIWQQ